MRTRLFFFFIIFSSLLANAQYFNPIIPDNVADPSISKFGDTYYLYGTTDIDKGLDQMGPPVVWKSKDFVNWSFEGTILPEIKWNTPYLYTNKEGIQKYGYFRYWAPGRAVKKGDLYYLFPTIVSPDGTCPVYTLVSESPEGPFRFQNGDGLFWGEVPEGKTASQPFLPDIDGEPFTDDDGQTYMYWRRWKAAQVSPDFTQIEGDILTIPTKRTAYSEGPTLFKRNGLYYYVYTQGGDQNYRNAYMISKEGPLTGYKAPAGKDVFISSSLENGVWRPGHGNVFYDEDSDTHLFAYLEFGEGSTTRQVFVDKMEFNRDGTIKTIVPGFEGVGYLNNTPDKRINLALKAKVTASSHKAPLTSSKKVYTNFDGAEPDEATAVMATREFTYEPKNAIDGSNGTRWMASGDDKRPWLMLDFGEQKSLATCEMSFNFPAFGHAWILEKSLDGKSWEVCAMQNEAVARSPHVACDLGEARYLRVKIIQGDPGLWEIKVYEDDNTWGAWTQWGDQGNGTYRNPVIPSDYSDIDCIRVGDDYYAISSTFQYSPGMVVLHSKDLVNWTIKGHVVSDLNQISEEMNWTRMNRYGRGIWAGAIRYHQGKFYVYFGTPDEGYFMSTASDPAGPWEPLHCIKAEAGWDDCCPFFDEDGQAYFVGTHFADNYKTYLYRMTADGRNLIEDSKILINEGAGREASKLYKINGTYYHFFSEVGQGGRYIMMQRASSITGPYLEKKQLSHVQREYNEPNQGGLVEGPDGKWYFFTHHGTGDWAGRIASLLPVHWIDGWPIIGRVGQDGIGTMVWQATKPSNQYPAQTPQASDDFSKAQLSPQWEWNYQPRNEMWSLTENPGSLRLKAYRPLVADELLKAGNTLTQRCFRTNKSEVVVKINLEGMVDGQKAGLCHYSKAYAMLGVSQSGKKRVLAFQTDKEIIKGPTIKGYHIWLKSTWGLDGKCQFSYSQDGKHFLPFGEDYQHTWDYYRGSRIGIYNFNNKEDAGYVNVEDFTYLY